MKATCRELRALLIPALLLSLIPGARGQTTFVNPGSYATDNVTPGIAGFTLEGDGWFWWGNGPFDSSEFTLSGKIGYQALPTSSHRRIATSTLLNPDKCSAARDEAYAYYFARTSPSSEAFLYRKSLGDAEADPGVLFDANGTTVSLPAGQSSRLWVDGDYLYYQLQVFFPIGGAFTRLYRVRRDGTAIRQTFTAISGYHFITEFEPFTYLAGSPFAFPRTGHLLLTEGRQLHVLDVEGNLSLSRTNVWDLAVQPPSGILSVSRVFTVENTGGEGSAAANLYTISPISGNGTLLRNWPGYHFLAVDIANWPNDAAGRVFLHRAIPGGFGLYHSHTVQRQLTQGSYVNWDQFLATQFEGRLTGSREWVYYVHDFRIKGKRSDAPPEELDVDFLGLEITQGVQSLGHGAVLVAGKPTYARGYARLSTNTTPKSDWYTHARLYGTRAGNPLPGSPLEPVTLQQLATSDTLPNQRNLGDGYLFEVPPSWTTAGGTTFELRLNETLSVPETGGAGNNGTVAVGFVGKARTCLKFRPLRTDAPAYFADSPGSGLPQILQRCKSLIPVSDLDVRFNNSVKSKPVFFVEIEYVPCFPLICAVPLIKLRHDPYNLDDSSDNDGSWALFWLGVDRLLESDPCSDYHLTGTVHPSLPTFNGIGGRGDLNLTDLWEEFPDIAIPDSDWASVLVVRMTTEATMGALTPGGNDQVVPFNSTYGGRTLAHELGHNYGRKHINQDPKVCGGSTPDGPYDVPPFNACTFGSSSGGSAAAAVAGFDTVGVAPVRNDLGIWGDLMTYSDARWTSVWNWNAIANRIPTLVSAPATPAPSPGNAPGSWIVIKGFYDTTSGEAHLMPCEILPDGVIPPAKLARSLDAEDAIPEQSPIEVCQIDETGAVIATHKAVPFAFPAEDAAPPGQLWFLQVVPCTEGMAGIQLCDDGSPVAWLPRSPHPPKVTVNAPVHDLANELLHLSWEGSDPDGTPLLFSVFYSPDNGLSWRAIADTLDTTELTISTRRLPGGEFARVRVIACDGIDTSVDESDPFSCPTRPPDIRIDQLPEGGRFPYGTPVKPLVFACDNEDGLLDPQWTLSGPTGLAGEGDAPCLRGLAPGSYLFEANATDSDAMAGSGQRTFEVLAIEVPDGAEPILDGFCADATYDGAAHIVHPTGARVSLVHAGGRLYVSLCDLPYPLLAGNAAAGIVIDTDGSAGPGEGPGASARGFHVDEDGIPWQTLGNGSTLVEDGEPPLGFRTAVQRGEDTWSAEFCIEESLLGGWDHGVRLFVELSRGLGFGGTTLRSRWPQGVDPDEPADWAAAWLGALPPPANQAPHAIVPPQVVAVASEFESIHLDGSGSEDPDGDELHFSWSQLSGPVVPLVNADAPMASFAPPAVGALTPMVFQLVVDDGSLPSTAAELTVLLLPDPAPFVEQASGGSTLFVHQVIHNQAEERLEITFYGQPGETYDIQHLNAAQAWEDVGDATADAMGRFVAFEPVTTDPVGLYRASDPP